VKSSCDDTRREDVEDRESRRERAQEAAFYQQGKSNLCTRSEDENRRVKDRTIGKSPAFQRPLTPDIEYSVLQACYAIMGKCISIKAKLGIPITYNETDQAI